MTLKQLNLVFPILLFNGEHDMLDELDDDCLAAWPPSTFVCTNNDWMCHHIIYMAHCKVISPKLLKNGDFFFVTPRNNCMNTFFSHLFCIFFLFMMKKFQKISSFNSQVISRVCTALPKLGVFSKLSKFSFFVA